MAITKLSYTRSKAGAKASLDYYTHRPNREGKRATRELFDSDGKSSKRHGYLLIKKAPWDTVFLRIALSPDPNLEDAQKDLNLRQLTEQTITRLEKLLKQKRIHYIATEHADQTVIRHTHIIALVGARNLTRGQLTLGDLDALYQGATQDALKMRQELDQDRAITRQVARGALAKEPQAKQAIATPAPKPRQPAFKRSTDQPLRSSGGALRQTPTCPNCGPYTPMERSGRLFECPYCGMAVSRGYAQGFAIERRPGLELSLEEVGSV